MARPFKLPDLGEGIHEGEVLNVLVSVGDYVKEDDPILEIETDNASRIEYLAKQGLHFPNANVDEATRASFGNVNVYPTIFMVSADGKVVSHLLNFQTREKLEPIIRQLIGG